jgi:hypothetical protein
MLFHILQRQVVPYSTETDYSMFYRYTLFDNLHISAIPYFTITGYSLFYRDRLFYIKFHRERLFHIPQRPTVPFFTETETGVPYSLRWLFCIQRRGIIFKYQIYLIFAHRKPVLY